MEGEVLWPEKGAVFKGGEVTACGEKKENSPTNQKTQEVGDEVVAGEKRRRSRRRLSEEISPPFPSP